MNYDTVAAANALEQYASENVEPEDWRLSSFVEINKITELYQIIQVNGPKTWRLVGAEVNESEREEAVFTLQGVIIMKDLPPVTDKPKLLTNDRYKYLRQSLTLTGFGSPTFNNAVSAAQTIHRLFDRNFAESEMEPWTIATAGEQLSFDMTNRYFTPTKDTPLMQHVPFKNDVDPLGILEGMAQAGYTHGEENEVGYYKRYDKGPDKRAFQEVHPQTFRIGDIVEVQLTFAVVPLKGKRVKMLSVLRSIVLLDRKFGEAARNANTIPSAPMAITLKRRVGYGMLEEQRSKGNKGKQQGMDIDKE